MWARLRRPLLRRLLRAYFSARSQICEKWRLASSHLSVYLSVWLAGWPHGTARLPVDGCSWNLIFEDFSKISPENSSCILTLNLLTTTIVAPPSNASKWQMGFNSAFKGLKSDKNIGYCTWRHRYIYGYRGKSVPLQAWSGPEGSRKLRFPDFMTTAQDCGKVVSLTHWPSLPPGNNLLLISVRGWADSRAIGLCHWKIPMTPSGIEPATCPFEL